MYLKKAWISILDKIEVLFMKVDKVHVIVRFKYQLLKYIGENFKYCLFVIF